MRHILHADFDAFYASVEQEDKHHLKGTPVVVGGSPEGRGVVASASYEARRFGIHSAMPMRTAMRLCPQATRVKPRFDRYNEVSRQVNTIFRELTPLVEPSSMDEAHLDITESVTAGNSPTQLARELKRRVKIVLGLTISVGVGTNKSVAKIASGVDKPDGLTIVPPGSEREFLAPLLVGKLPGIGPKTTQQLMIEGIQTIGDLAAQQGQWFHSRFGRMGTHFRSLAQGQDERPVVVGRERKSVSAEMTLTQDTNDPKILLELISSLSQRVARYMEISHLHGRTIKVKLRLADFYTFTRQKTLAEPTQASKDIALAAGSLLETETHQDRFFRLLGVGVSGFTHYQSEGHQPKLKGFE